MRAQIKAYAIWKLRIKRDGRPIISTGQRQNKIKEGKRDRSFVLVYRFYDYFHFVYTKYFDDTPYSIWFHYIKY